MLQVKVKVKHVEILGNHLIGREQSRHPFAVILLVTTLWRLPSCFAAILFCADTITRRRCGARSKVADLLHLYNCQLGLGLVTLIMSSVVNPDTNPVGLVTLMKGQRSKVTDLLYLYNCQLGLGLVTLILSSVVNPKTNPLGLVTLMKGQRSNITDLLCLYSCKLGLVTLIPSPCAYCQQTYVGETGH